MVSSKKESKPPPNYAEKPPNGTVIAAEHYPEPDDCEEDFPDLTLKEKFCYGVGHVFNDLCASMWFSYLLIFFEKVLLFQDTAAGLILLVGQLADGISTPIVGILSDKENKIPICNRYGRRKTWHLLGTVCVAVSFPFIFSPAYGVEDASTLVKTLYYCAFVCVFQFGWASVQISHLALIPDLTPKKHQRTLLNSIRYSFTVLSNLSVFAITYFMLQMAKHPHSKSAGGNSTTMAATTMPTVMATMASAMVTNVTMTPMAGSCSIAASFLCPSNLFQFQRIAYICVAMGVFFSLIFHFGVKEPVFVKPCMETHANKTVMRKLDWFKQLPFYLVALLYMATRLYVNLYQVYIPLFVQDTLCLDKSYIAIVPFVMYLAGFFCSLVMKPLNKFIGRKATFGSGCLLGLIGCIWAFTDGYSHHDEFVSWGIFVVGIFLGSGGSTLLVTSLSITADLIGKNTEGGAFVYGLMSLVDKFSNGIIIMIIQKNITGAGAYYRDVIFYACGGSCVVGLIVIFLLIPIRVSVRKGVSQKEWGDSDNDVITISGAVDNKYPYNSAYSEVMESKPKIYVDTSLKPNGICSKTNPVTETLGEVAFRIGDNPNDRLKPNGICSKTNPIAETLDEVAFRIGDNPNVRHNLDLQDVSSSKNRSVPGSPIRRGSRDRRLSSVTSLLSICTHEHKKEGVCSGLNPAGTALDAMTQGVREAAERRRMSSRTSSTNLA